MVEARAAYLKVRRKADLEKQHKAAEAYHDKKKAQDRLYEEAIQRTRLFYNVQRPNNGYPVTIGKPADPAVDYITGLEVAWNPKPAEYNPDGMLGIKIRGADGLDHYSGVVRDAEDGIQKLAITLENGKVLIFKEAFEIARKYKNPGYIGHLLFHEARHFNQLSRGLQDGSAGSRSWASKQEDEAEAYSSDAAWADAFGLDAEDIKGLNEQLKKFEAAVANKQFTWKNPDPVLETRRKKYYEEVQVNLEEEYSALYAEVKAAKKKQEEQQNEERARRAREIEEREQREHGEENARETERRSKIFDRKEMENEAAACGYKFIIRSRKTDAVMGIRGLQRGHYFSSDGVLPSSSKDLRIVLLLTRTCDAIKGNYQQEACNDSTPAIRERASSVELKTQLDHILGLPTDNLDGDTRACVDFFISNADKISDAKSLDKVIVKYRKRLAEEKREYDKRWGSDPKTPPSRDGGGSRPPDDNNDRIWDQDCGCWIRRY